MTSVIYNNYNSIPFMSGSYAGARVNGPIHHQHPGIVSCNINNGILVGQHPNPPHFGVADTSGVLANGRQQYLRTNTTQFNMGTGTKDYCDPNTARPTSVYHPETQRSYTQSQCTKYNAPKDSSLYISARKAAAIGKSSFKNTLPNSAPLSYKSYDRNDVRTLLRRTRNAGCVAPAKKGSIFNRYQTNTPWGAIPRSTY